MEYPKELKITQLKLLEENIAAVIGPPSRKLISEFAEEHRQLSREANAEGGKWHNLPMQVEPMDAGLEPDVTDVVLMWAAQTAGKTELILNVAAYFSYEDPSPQLMIQPTLEMAETWSKDRFDPMVRDTPVLKGRLLNKSRSSSNTIYHKKYPGGQLTIAGANSPASLASRPIRVGLFDEIDRFPESAGNEGDPIQLGKKRQDTFFNAFTLLTSTPTVKRHSRIEKQFDLSDKRYWHVCCAYCDHEQTLKWVQVRLNEEFPELTTYECSNPECKEQWSDAQRMAAVMGGRWIATAPFRGVRGYHLNGIYSVFRAKKGFKHRLHQMAVEFMEAKKLGKEVYRVWVNTFLAETYEDKIEAKTDWRKLEERKEQYGEQNVPEKVIYITAGVDFAADRAEIEFVGHGIGEESWGVGHHVLYGDCRLPELYTRVEASLLREFTRSDGAVLTAGAVGFDTGYHACQRQLYAFLGKRQSRNWYAFKGASQPNAEPVGHSTKSKVQAVRLILVGTNRLKSYIYSRASIEVPGPGYMHFPAAYSQEWFKQLMSEEFRKVRKGGADYYEFYMPEVIEKDSTANNEALDMRVYNLAALIARGGLNWRLQEQRNLRTIPKDEANTHKQIDQLAALENSSAASGPPLVTLEKKTPEVVHPSLLKRKTRHVSVHGKARRFMKRFG